MSMADETPHVSNPHLLRDIQKLGAFDVSACFSCGTCTSVCPLSDGATVFPRKIITYAQLGLEEKILASPEPWLCYYCGECTDNCPRGADPAGFMMATRRWLTTKYDVTGISKRLYGSKLAEWIGIGLLVLLAGLLAFWYHGPIVTSTVALSTFAPIHLVELADWTVLGVLSVFLLANVFRMYYYTVLRIPGKRIPFSAYVKNVLILPITFFTQYKFASCKKDPKKHWFSHLSRYLGYAMLFVLAVFLLSEWQTDTYYPLWSPIMLLQYAAAGLLIYGLSGPLYGRLKKTENQYKYSHSTDWMFLLLLLATALTGVAVVTFKYTYLPWAAYITYAFHLMLVTALLVLEVPFAKWSHMAYRTFAPYFAKLQALRGTPLAGGSKPG